MIYEHFLSAQQAVALNTFYHRVFKLDPSVNKSSDAKAIRAAKILKLLEKHSSNDVVSQKRTPYRQLGQSGQQKEFQLVTGYELAEQAKVHGIKKVEQYGQYEKFRLSQFPKAGGQQFYEQFYPKKPRFFAAGHSSPLESTAGISVDRESMCESLPDRTCTPKEIQFRQDILK